MDEKPPENILETLLKAAFEKVWCLKSEDKLRKKGRKIEKYTKFRTIYLHSPLLKTDSARANRSARYNGLN